MPMIAFGAGKTPVMGSNKSGVKTASAAIVTGRCVFTGVMIETDGTNDAVINLYDNTAGSGTQILPQVTVKGGDHYGGVFHSVYCATGIYLTISGTGAKAEVYYEDGT